MLTHADIWKAIDLLAQRNGLSPSGLAIKAGLSSTLFNPSKRMTAKRKRWPSTESIAAILQATDTTMEDFVALISPSSMKHAKIPLLSPVETARLRGAQPSPEALSQGNGHIMALPGATDPHAFAVEITDTSFEPAYREGSRIIVSPSEKLRRGDRVLTLTTSGEILIKQLGREGAQKIELLSSQSDMPPLTLARAEIVWMFRITWVSQ